MKHGTWNREQEAEREEWFGRVSMLGRRSNDEWLVGRI